MVEGVYRVELLSLARAFQEKEKEEIRLQTLKEQYPKTTLLLHKLFHLFVSFELLDQVYSGYREFLFRDIYKTMINLQKVFEKQKQELLGETLKRIEKAQQEGKLDLVFQLSMDASLQVKELERSIFSSEEESFKKKIKDVAPQWSSLFSKQIQFYKELEALESFDDILYFKNFLKQRKENLILLSNPERLQKAFHFSD
ncbi:MAG: hypothetical protein A3A72_08665 [Deltaproteobacteria bacterium RIFCSPLOWO2_01_FULL_38_9]|nr:MAG: hypothetical protein A3A72_08665 [Deltaproteobacteria bacterium RIFCSPLOWO2_01_FULL_38_9]